MAKNLNILELEKKSLRRKNAKLLAIIVLIIIFILRLVLLFFTSNFGIKVTAHRGSTSFSPENSLASVVEAITFNCDYIEIDVQLTKDLEVILLHDMNFNRVAGVNRRPSDMNYEEIQELNIGFYKNSLIEHKVPLLQEIIDTCKFSDIFINIEVKDYWNPRLLTKKVVQIIEENDFESRCVITSFSKEILKYVKTLNSKIKVGLITSSRLLSTYVLNDYADFYSINYFALTPEISTYVHSKNKKIYAWTPNNKAEIVYAITNGADNIITDNVALAQLMIFSLNK